MPANSPSVTPFQSLPQRNSIFNLPKKPSARALSELQPFLDIDLAMPRSSHILIHLGQRQWQPRSLRPLGCSPSLSWAHAPRSDGFAISASGVAEIVQLIGMPSKQSIIGERRVFPARRRGARCWR